MKLFPVILTDRGSEFTDPAAIEFDKDGNRRTYVFYCDPQRSSQKGSIEVTHEFIRRILPKGTSFKDMERTAIKNMTESIRKYSVDIDETFI
jgi:IS30 family transposase